MNPPEPEDSVKTDRGSDLPSLDETMQLQGDTSPASIHGLRDRPEQWVGRVLGKYEVTALLGSGGMGVVLKAYDPSIERDVAIKVLPAELSTDETTLNRFLSEAKSAGKLNHPNTVTIHEVGQDNNVHYLVMEVVSGGSAADYLARVGPYSVNESTRLVIEACRGLAAAHQQNLIHRDIKPANLLLTQDGTAKVADFGLAKRTEMRSMILTQEGHLVGTPYYMSPEQCQGLQVDARSDIYSLGATYYSLLTGQCPFQNIESVVQVMFAHCNAGPPDPRDVLTNVPAACTAVIQRAMSKKPDQRYQSMDKMRVDLEAIMAAMSGSDIRLPSASLPTLVRPDNELSFNRRKNLLATFVVALVLFAVIGSGIAYRFFSGISRSVDLTDPEKLSQAMALASPSGEPIRIGILHSLTGTMARSGTSVAEATLLAVDELNRSGGVLGRPVEAIVADGRSDPAKFLVEARRLIEEEKVSTIFGCWTSASRKTVVPLFEELDHLLVYPLQYEGIEESPHVIYTGATPNQQVIPAVKWAYAFENKRRFFLVGSDYVFPRVVHEIIKDQLQELGGAVP